LLLLFIIFEMSKRCVLKVEKNAHEDAVWCVSWRVQRIITGSACAASHIKAWNTSAGDMFSLTPSAPIDGSKFPLAIVSVSQQRDGPAFVAGSLDGTLVAYETSPPVVVALEPSAPRADATPATTTVAAPTPSAPKVISQEPGCAWGATFNPAGGTIVATTGQGGEVFLHDISGTKKRESLKTASKCCSALGWSPDGRIIAAGGMEGATTVLDVANKKRLLTIPAHAKAIRAVRFSGDGRLLITAGDDGCINVRDVEKGALIASITGHESWVCALDTCVASPRTLVSAGADGTVRLWDLSINAHVLTFSEHHGQCWGVALNDDGSQIASVGDDKSLIVYSIV